MEYVFAADAVAATEDVHSEETLGASIDAFDLAETLVVNERVEVLAENIEIAHAGRVDGQDAVRLAFLAQHEDYRL